MSIPRKYVVGALFTQGDRPPWPPHHTRLVPEMGRAWAESVVAHGYEAILFTDADCSFLPVTEVRVPCRGFPHTYRFVVIGQYLKQKNLRGEVWCTDVRDVIMNKKPEPKPGCLYAGSESLSIGGWDWLATRAQGCPFWSNMIKPPVIYNCGVMGGIDIVDFTARLGELNRICTGLNDMHAFSYALQAQKNVVTGYPVHNVFTSHTHSDEWFVHK